jgi:hypothetical protein
LRRDQIVPTHGARQDRLSRLIRRQHPDLDHVDLGQAFERSPYRDNRLGHQRCHEQFGSSIGWQIAIPRVEVAGMPLEPQSKRHLPEPRTVIWHCSAWRQCERLDDSIPQSAPFPSASPSVMNTAE